MTVATQLFKIGDAVLESGMYVCVPCGFMQEFVFGERFTTCLACLAGTANGPADFQDEESEFWQFMS